MKEIVDGGGKMGEYLCECMCECMCVYASRYVSKGLCVCEKLSD